MLLAVFAGGALGGLARTVWTEHWHPASVFPWPIFVINALGSFVLAIVVTVSERNPSAPRWLRPLLGTGVCGGFTTFSAVTVAVDRLAAHGEPLIAATYFVTSIVAGLVAAFLGTLVVHRPGPLASPEAVS